MSAAPDEVRGLARARAEARAARDWAEADRLRTEIEAAGWRITDRGNDFSLQPAHPPDLVEEGLIRYGSSSSIPSRLAEPDGAAATVILLAADQPDDLARALAGLRADAPAETQVVVVADGASPDQETALLAADGPAGLPIAGRAVEVIWTSEPLGHAAALNVGLHRAAGHVVILLDTSVEPTGDLVGQLSRVLDDPSVAVAGPWGITSPDLRHFVEASPGEVDAIEAYALAFRRADLVERGLLDEHFRFYRNLDIWWSLVLRDEGEGRPPRHAVMVGDPAATRHEHRGYASLEPAERDRRSKRNFYRIIDRFGSRRDLLVSPVPAAPEG
jgi:glycosyltransferase involved in cell wall biosynthesis